MTKLYTWFEVTNTVHHYLDLSLQFWSFTSVYKASRANNSSHMVQYLFKTLSVLNYLRKSFLSDTILRRSLHQSPSFNCILTHFTALHICPPLCLAAGEVYVSKMVSSFHTPNSACALHLSRTCYLSHPSHHIIRP